MTVPWPSYAYQEDSSFRYSVHPRHGVFEACRLERLDIAKAFNTVSWEFLLWLLQVMGFDPRWREWISLILSSASSLA